MLRLLAALAATVALGLLSRLHPVGFHLWDKSLGDALYAVAAYPALALVLIRQPTALVAPLALARGLRARISADRILAVFDPWESA